MEWVTSKIYATAPPIKFLCTSGPTYMTYPWLLGFFFNPNDIAILKFLKSENFERGKMGVGLGLVVSH